MSIDVTSSINQAGFDGTGDPVASGTMKDYANSWITLYNAILNGSQAADRFLFSSADTLQITSGAVASPTQEINYIQSETGTIDALTTIGASNNRRIIFKAYPGHIILIQSGLGNITTLDSNDITLSGNIILEAFCIGSQWSITATGGVKNNFAAATDPGTGDDTGDGYNYGSQWVNISNDRAWVNVSPTLAAAKWRKTTPDLNKVSVRAAAATLAQVGIAAPTIANTPANANGADGTYVTLPTTNSSGNLGGWVTATFNILRSSYDPIIEFLVKTDATITTQRLWVGLIDADITNTDTPTTRKIIGFRWSTNASDAGWIPCLGDGSTFTPGSAIGTVAASTAYKLRIRIASGTTTAYFSVNDSAETALTANFPAIATELGILCRCITTSAAIRLLNFSYAKVGW